MSVTVRLEGGKDFARKIDRLNLLATSQLKAAVAESSLNVQRKAKRRCPVDTGRLRASIDAVFYQGGMTGEVGTPVSYAPYVEFGTHRATAKPFLFPSWEEEKPNYIKNIESLFKGLEKTI